MTVHNVWVIVGLSVAAALCFAGSSSLKHVSAGETPDAQDLHIAKLRRLVRASVSHRLWLAGIGCDAGGLTLQVLALHFGALAVVQPVLVSSLLFTLVLRRQFEHHAVSRRELGWALLLTAALAGFVLLVGTAQPTSHDADRLPAVIAGALGGALAIGFVALGRRRRSSNHSAALLGVAVGIVYAATAALLKAVTDIAASHPVHLLWSWQVYLVIVLGAAGLLLGQLAFQAGPITASLPATATIDPLLSIAVGVSVYDEHIRHGATSATLLLGLLVVLVGSVIQLARTPDALADTALTAPGGERR